MSTSGAMAETLDDLIGLSRTKLRWGACFVVVACLFAGAFWAVLHWSPPAVSPPVSPEATVMIDLEPVPVTPPAPPSAPPPELPPPEPTPPPEEASPPMPEPPPSAPTPDIAIPVPPPPPPIRPPERHPAIRHPAAPRPEPVPAPAAPALPQAEAPPAAPAPRPNALPNAIPTWQSELLNRLAQVRRYPSEARYRGQQGVVQVHFSMNRQGQVLSASVAKSSGYPALDGEAIAMMHRAEPLPPPPPEIHGDPVELTVPVQFFLQ